MRDEFPGRAFLTPAEVKQLVGILNHKEWLQFLLQYPTFPAQVPLGQTAGKKPRLRYSKAKVYAFLEMLGA